MKSKLLLITLFLLTVAIQAKAQVITTFGVNATNGGAWSYTPATSIISGTESSFGGDFIFGTPLTSNLSGAISLNLTATATTAPASFFTITLEDNASGLATATFTWASFVGGASVSAPLVPFGPFNLGNVTGWSLDGGSSGQAINVTVTSLSAVPEPTTVGLGVLGTGALLVGMRRRKLAKA